MKNGLIAAFVMIFLAQCREDKQEVAPGVAKLVGTWQLVEPDSSYVVTLVLALDTANPPNDVTHFMATGKSAVNSYDGFLSAAVDGLLVFTNVGSTKIGGPPDATEFEQTYFNSLRATVRYELLTDNRLKLIYGGDKAGVLVYNRIK